MTDKEFRAMLDWYMCSDPWPVQKKDGSTDEENHKAMTELLNKKARRHGYQDWVDAYHRFK